MDGKHIACLRKLLLLRSQLPYSIIELYCYGEKPAYLVIKTFYSASLFSMLNLFPLSLSSVLACCKMLVNRNRGC